MSATYFTDRNLGKQFPTILKKAGVRVERFDDHFAHNVPDEEWLAVVAERGWVAITHDANIRRRPNQRAAVLDGGPGLIVVVGKLPFPELATHFARSIAAVERFVRKHERPWIARFYPPTPADMARKLKPRGRIEPWIAG
ncbi:MAG: PIN-like domain-containing protein [Gemmatimonadaceae bacterium]